MYLSMSMKAFINMAQVRYIVHTYLYYLHFLSNQQKLSRSNDTKQNKTKMFHSEKNIQQHSSIHSSSHVLGAVQSSAARPLGMFAAVGAAVRPIVRSFVLYRRNNRDRYTAGCLILRLQQCAWRRVCGGGRRRTRQSLLNFTGFFFS